MPDTIIHHREHSSIILDLCLKKNQYIGHHASRYYCRVCALNGCAPNSDDASRYSTELEIDVPFVGCAAQIIATITVLT
jgi:hypothetical protein